MMKKISRLLALFLVCASLASCASNDGGQSGIKDSQSQGSTEATTENAQDNLETQTSPAAGDVSDMESNNQMGGSEANLDIPNTPKSQNSPVSGGTSSLDPNDQNNNTEVTQENVQDTSGLHKNPTAGEAVDLDLSELGSVLAYSQVVNIMESPDDYIGKTIRINGQYYVSYYEPTEKYYHFIVIGDESLCCQAGIEFIWNGSHAYPDDYPDEQANIGVTGTFGRYEELGTTYYHLTIDDVSIL